MPGVPPARYAYLGPEGTFTEVALRTLPEAATRELVPMVSVPAALDAVRNGQAAAALVPIENSVEGGITATLDELTEVARARGTSIEVVAGREGAQYDLGTGVRA